MFTSKTLNGLDNELLRVEHELISKKLKVADLQKQHEQQQSLKDSLTERNFGNVPNTFQNPNRSYERLFTEDKNPKNCSCGCSVF